MNTEKRKVRMDKRISKATEMHRNEVRLKKKQQEKKERTEGLRYWRDKFREMARDSTVQTQVVLGAEKHVERMERGRGKDIMYPQQTKEECPLNTRSGGLQESGDS